MSIQTKCPGCGQRLLVDDQHAGRRAKCPACDTVHVVPAVERETCGDSAARDTQWWMKTPDSVVYGPVPKSTLDRWLTEGRIGGDCFLRSDEQSPWRPAGELYGQLAIPEVPSVQGKGDLTDDEKSTMAVGAAEIACPPRKERFIASHRAPVVLALGVVGWLTCCPIFSIAAWMMGASDLREMRNGRMDDRGVGRTQAGYILGITLSVFWLVLTTGAALLFMVGVVGRCLMLDL